MNRFYIELPDDEVTKLLAALQNTARFSRTHIAKQLLSTGLYAGQEGVMEALSANDGQTLGQIAAALGVKPPTITKTISRLQEQGFVERRNSETDARQTHVWLTAEGRAVLSTMQKAVQEAEKQALHGVKKKERKQLAKILSKIEANLTGQVPAEDKKKTGGGKKKKKAT
jgi:DNA-binding MarR family transcriptional regulator